MPFAYTRTIHFPDTDAAGVVFFANYLAICHEAYEEALGAAGLELNRVFIANGLLCPISKSTCDYLRPFACGDKVRVVVRPELLTPDSFALNYEMFRLGPPEKRAALARTEHVCIRTATRERTALPAELLAWINAG